MRRLFALAAAVTLLPAHAISQETPAAAAPSYLLLSCEGAVSETQQVGTKVTSETKEGPSPPFTVGKSGPPVTEVTSKPVYGRVKIPAHLDVAIEGETIRVRPPKGMIGKKSPDGWYQLTATAVTADRFTGGADFGWWTGKYRLTVDRRTGSAEFSGFSGVCEKIADDPQARRF